MERVARERLSGVVSRSCAGPLLTAVMRPQPHDVDCRCGYSKRMRTAGPAKSPNGVQIRRGEPADLDALWDIENRVFETDRMSRRSLRRLLGSPSAATVVAQSEGTIAGVAVVLFRATSRVARLYSLAVAPRHTGRGIASALLKAAENTARSRQCR